MDRFSHGRSLAGREPQPLRGAVSRKMPPLDFRQLSYFLAVAEHGSISSAAETLELAQPTLSENLSRLERHLGVTLTIRSSRGVQLTEAGLVFAEHGRELVRSVATMLDAVEQVGTEAKGPVSIGLPSSLGLLLTVPLAETIQNELPQISLHIAEAMSGDLLDWVASERLDVACVYETIDEQSLVFQPMLTEKLFLVTAPDNLPSGVETSEDGHRSIRGADLVALPLVLPSGPHGARKVIERFARSNNIRLTVALEIDSLPQIITMAKRASAHSILPHAAVIDEVAEDKLALIEIVEPTMSRTAYIVRKRSRPVTRASCAVESAMCIIVSEMIERFQLEAVIPDRNRS